MPLDLRTETEKARDAKHQRVCAKYLSYKENYPGVSAHRLISKVAEEEDMTVPGVRNILINNGLYTTVRK